MSQENVETVKRYYDEPPDNPEQFGALAERLWEADGDYYPVREFPEARPCHGREEIVEFLTEYLTAWDAYRYVVKEVRVIGDDRVFVHGHVWAEGVRAALRWKATSITAAGSGTDDSSGSRAT
jgi:hypothetical protein